MTAETQIAQNQPSLEKEASGTTNSTTYELKTGRWSADEHDRFLEALRIYGKDWEEIEKHVGTRKLPNIRAHGQKFLEKLIKLLDSDDLEMDEEELQ